MRQRVLVVGIAPRHDPESRPDLVERSLDKHPIIVVDPFLNSFPVMARSFNKSEHEETSYHAYSAPSAKYHIARL